MEKEQLLGVTRAHSREFLLNIPLSFGSIDKRPAGVPVAQPTADGEQAGAGVADDRYEFFHIDN